MVSKILKFGKQKGSSLNFSAHGGWGKEKNLKSAEKSVRPKSFGGEAQAGGQKGRGLGRRNFCPTASVSIPFEQRKSGRGVWGEFRFSFAKSN